ncbi:MAG: hypothetical protein WC044_05470 [Crocinitomicaceae bacterium]
MKFNILSLISLLFIAPILFSQNNGFIGKKNFISADVRAFTPLVAGLFSTDESYHKTEGTSYLPTKNLIDYGFNFSIGRAMARNFGVILQYGISFYDFSYSSGDGDFNYNAANPPIDPNYYNYYTTLNKTNWFHAKSTTFMPILELTNRSGLLPLGLSHQIGLGFTKHTFQEDNYNIQFIGNDGVENYTPTNLYDYKNGSIRSIVMMYKINLRIPVTKFLLFNLGFRYNLNMVRDPSYLFFNDANASQYVIDQSTFREMIRNKEFSNIMSLETGFSFCF